MSGVRRSWLSTSRSRPAKNPVSRHTFRFRTPSYVCVGCAEGARLQRLVAGRQQVLTSAAVSLASRDNGRGEPWHAGSASRNVEPLVALRRLAPAPGGYHASALGISAPTSPAYKRSGRSQRGTWRRSWPVTWVMDGNMLSASRLARCLVSIRASLEGVDCGTAVLSGWPVEDVSILNLPTGDHLDGGPWDRTVRSSLSSCQG